jgi:hypothetical protein
VLVILSAAGCEIPFEGSFTISLRTLALDVLLTFCTNPRKPGRPVFLESSDETIFTIQLPHFQTVGVIARTRTAFPWAMLCFLAFLRRAGLGKVYILNFCHFFSNFLTT